MRVVLLQRLLQKYLLEPGDEVVLLLLELIENSILLDEQLVHIIVNVGISDQLIDLELVLIEFVYVFVLVCGDLTVNHSLIHAPAGTV